MSEVLDQVRAKIALVRERFFAVVGDLDDAQIAWRPSPRAHNIGFALWHTVRSEDNAQADITGDPTVWESGGYATRWGHPERGQGTLWDDERAASLVMPPRDELFEYVRRVGAALDAAGATIDDDGFTRVVKSRFLGRDASVGDILLTCLGHDNRHLGEMEYIKGLLGLKGTATV